MKANCGYAELDVVASEYHFEGLPSELPAGPTIITLDNVGEQVHEIYIGRINDDVTLTVEELAELPEDQLHGPMVTPTAFASTFPEATSYGAADLTSGRYIAMCFLPEGATLEVLIELKGRSRRARGLASRGHRGRTKALHHRNDRRVQRRLTHAPCHQDSNGRIDRRPHRPIPRNEISLATTSSEPQLLAHQHAATNHAGPDTDRRVGRAPCDSSPSSS